MIYRLKIVMVAFAALGLAGCSGGGGGGGGSAQNSQTQMGSGGNYTSATYPSDWMSREEISKPQTTGITRLINDLGLPLEELGTLAKPFWQQSLAYRGITDPNAVVLSPSNVKYDLTWGSVDFRGPSYASKVSETNFVYDSSFKVYGHWISGQCINGPTIGQCPNGAKLKSPHPDVVEAWKLGWTGAGRNILIADVINASSGYSPNIYDDGHSLTTTSLAHLYAPGAAMFGIDSDVSINPSQVKIVDVLGSYASFSSTGTPNKPNPSRTTNGFYFDVMNLSLGHNYYLDFDGNPTPEQVNQAFEIRTAWVAGWVNFINGTTNIKAVHSPDSTTNVFMTDAVITKSAGNDAIETQKEPLSYGLAHDSLINPRLIVVGALDKDGSVNSKAELAWYSNVAGTDLAIQNRFLVADGTFAVNVGDLAINGIPVSPSAANGAGTSYAAPRVAGYAAIVRQKFPNLSGANTADILLATARYDTLTCHPNCSKEIYGQGEASLSRALAPVGLLK